MPVVIFLGSIVNVLFYFGAIQYIILKVSFVINLIMKTSPTESMNSTANVFLGLSDAPLLIRPFLPIMTRVHKSFSLVMRGVLKCGDGGIFTQKPGERNAGDFSKCGGSIPVVTLNAGARGTWRLIMGVSKK